MRSPFLGFEMARGLDPASSRCPVFPVRRGRAIDFALACALVLALPLAQRAVGGLASRTVGGLASRTVGGLASRTVGGLASPWDGEGAPLGAAESGGPTSSPDDSPLALCVSSSEELRRALADPRPGLRVLLAPGVYQGGIFLTGLRGSAEAPIVIAGRDPFDPPVLRGGDCGLHLIDPSWVELRNLAIEGARHNGLNIDDGGSPDTPARGLVLRDIVVRSVGAGGNEDGIKLSGLEDFRILSSRVEGWGKGGSAIDMVGCRKGVIDRCVFRGDPLAPSATGVQTKGGTHDIAIRRSTFEHAGDRALQLGGSTGLAYFRPKPEGFEARDITVEGCTVFGSQAPVTFVGIDRAIVRHNTFYRPRKWILRILQETREPGFVPSRGGVFERNLIVYRTREMAGGVNVGSGTAPETFTFRENYWHAMDAPKVGHPALPTEEVVSPGLVVGEADPRLLDPEGGDARPAAGSPAAAWGAESLPASPLDEPLRRRISLDGEWAVAEGSFEAPSGPFDRRVPVPGLVDMALPPFEDVGVKSPRREAFWLTRSFRLEGPVPAVASLEIRKAAYGMRVVLNGRSLGDRHSSFTRQSFDLASSLRGDGALEELQVRVGAFRDAVPEGVPSGWDFEKARYIPGIYDEVSIALHGTPHTREFQLVPDPAHGLVRARAVVVNAGPAAPLIPRFTVREAVTGRVVATLPLPRATLARDEERVVEAEIPILGARLWSPEDPFLYECEAATGRDSIRERFGLRSFAFDPAGGHAVLNGRPRYLRGTNVCILRFFEDPARGDKPWREDWVRRLHRRFREMGWDSIRYCIGFPPELWYRVADEEGLLIADEYPLWHLGEWPQALHAEALSREYAAWMRERWNHPSVVIWDAQNETATEETGKAIDLVRALDLSARPWDNGWAAPRAPGDAFESHPYVFMNPSFRLEGLGAFASTPVGNPASNAGKNAVIINEYAWLWLNRDGTPTTLTRQVYENLLGPGASPEALRVTYARYLAAETEYFRSRREAAGVLHFCGLGYSRPGGQTSDPWIDLERLEWEPNFWKHVRPAFAPVGICLDSWAEEASPGEAKPVRAIVVNDLDRAWSGRVRLRLWHCGDPLLGSARDETGAKSGAVVSGGAAEPASGGDVLDLVEAIEVPPLGRVSVSFPVTFPTEPGAYRMEAKLESAPRAMEAGLEGETKAVEDPVSSLRDIEILSEEARRARRGLAAGKQVSASSAVTVGAESYPAALAVDGVRTTRWSSEFSDPQWIAVDLGRKERFSRVVLFWEGAYAKDYGIELSSDGEDWREVWRTEAGDGGRDEIRFDPAEARWVRMSGRRRGTAFGYSLWEFQVFP